MLESKVGNYNSEVSKAVATDRSEGDIVVVGVEGDSVKSEGRTALLGDSGVVW